MKVSPEVEAQCLALAGEAVPVPAFANEAAFLRAVTREAVKRGWRVYHTHDSRRSAAGFPDLVLVRNFTVFAELKVWNGTITQAQADWLSALRRAGAEAYLWRPSDWPQILKVLA